MGTWTVWHFGAFLLIAGVGWARAVGRQQPAPTGRGGWLALITLFLLYWAAHELAEFYRVRHEVSVLVPSAFDSPEFLTYLRNAYVLAWLQTLLLAGAAALLTFARPRWVPAAVIALMIVAGPVVTAAEFLQAEYYVGDFLIDDDYSSLLATTLFTITFSLYLRRSARVASIWPR